MTSAVAAFAKNAGYRRQAVGNSCWGNDLGVCNKFVTELQQKMASDQNMAASPLYASHFRD